MQADQIQNFVSEVQRRLPKGCTINQSEFPGIYAVIDGYTIVGGVQFRRKGPSYWCVEGKENLPIVVKVKAAIDGVIKGVRDAA